MIIMRRKKKKNSQKQAANLGSFTSFLLPEWHVYGKVKNGGHF